MTTKPFDCVDMKRRGAEHVWKAISHMSAAEELAFWQEQTRKLRDEASHVPHANDAKSGSHENADKRQVG